MSVELVLRCHKKFKGYDNSNLGSNLICSTYSGSNELVVRGKDDSDSGKPQFRGANYINDLESIWWIIVWTWLHFDKDRGAGSSSSVIYNADERSQIASELFPGTVEIDLRRNFLYKNFTFMDYKAVIPNTLPGLGETMSVFREKLIEAYIKDKGTIKHCKLLIDDLHEELLKAIELAPKEDLNLILVEIDSVALSKTQSSSTYKRSSIDENEEYEPRKKARYGHSAL